ncbi:phage holin family protein [Rosenbergiella australiborealis]|uniref:phage holin family protein n=1 Tax=Rosenbergiella australiborealis TaxID=1544696 RepID=UPI0030B8ECBF
MISPVFLNVYEEGMGMLINEYAACVNTLLSTLIVLAISLYRRGSSTYRPAVSWLAWLVVITYGSIPLRYLTGQYEATHWAVVLTNLFICIMIFKVRGNLARIIDFRF